MKTKFICPQCRDEGRPTVNLIVTGANPRPECPVCGFKCRRYGNTMIDQSEDRRGAFNSVGNWDARFTKYDRGGKDRIWHSSWGAEN
jgi:hypothetical protein